MAELFKPEIKDVGGTNVTAYSPPSMDYSGIFNSLARTIDSFEREKTKAPKLSEAEEKNLILEPYISKVQKIMTSEMPEVKQYAMVNGVRLEFARKYPAYREVFESAIDTSLNILDPDGDPIKKYYEDVAKWGESPEGTFARAKAITTAVDDDGNFNEELYQSTLNQAYHSDLATAEDLRRQKALNEQYKENAPAQFRTDFVPKAASDIDNDIKTFTSKQGIKALLQVTEQGGAFVTGTPEASQALAIADQIAQLRKRWDMELTRRKIEAKYDINDAQYSNTPLLLPLQVLEDSFRNAGSSMGAILKSTNEDLKQATFAQLPPLAKDFIIKAGLFPPGASDLFVAEGLANPDIRRQIKNPTILGLDPRVSTQGSGTSTLTALPSGPGVSLQEMQRALPEHNPKVVEIIANAPASDKKKVLEATNIYIEKGADLTDTKSVDAVNYKLDATYAILSMRFSGDAEIGVTPLDQTKVYFGPKAMNLIAEVGKKNPVYAESLYPVVNKAIMNETTRHMGYLQSSINRNFPNNPIVLSVNDKGMVEIKLDPRAKKEDPLFMRLSNLGFETDEEMFENLQTVVAMPPSFMKGLRESVEALNTYLMAANKFPDSLKNSPDFAGSYIRQQLETLPKYGGASILLEQLGE